MTSEEIHAEIWSLLQTARSDGKIDSALFGGLHSLARRMKGAGIGVAKVELSSNLRTTLSGRGKEAADTLQAEMAGNGFTGEAYKIIGVKDHEKPELKQYEIVTDFYFLMKLINRDDYTRCPPFGIGEIVVLPK